MSCSIAPQGYVHGSVYAGQAITPILATGLLTRVEIAISKPPGTDEDYVIEIRAAALPLRPTATVLASTVIPSAGVPTGDSVISASFPNPVKFTQRDFYLLVIHRAADLLVGIHGEQFCGLSLFFGNDPSGSDWIVGDYPEAEYNIYVTPPTCMGEPATIVGTTGNDVRQGTSGRDVIAGMGGKDTLTGLGGNDLICGGPGSDTLSGGQGNDTLVGRKGDDALSGGQDNDTLLGRKGDDGLRGGKGNDTLVGHMGADALNGGKGADTLLGHEGKDTLRGGPGNDRLKGGAGKDTQIQ